MRVRIFPEHNYKALHFDSGNTVRVALNPSKPITRLHYPEFYDVKVTSKCGGKCPYCYQSSIESVEGHTGIVDRFLGFFSRFDENQMPFQIAFGAGEPTEHPEFLRLMQACANLKVTPNYTTNGMWTDKPDAAFTLAETIRLCGGVAVSTHPHLERHWRKATAQYLEEGMHTNLHVIIGDRDSIDTFSRVYEEFSGRVKYFVLLPLSAQGRSDKSFSDWDYFISKTPSEAPDIAFGANFYPYLVKEPGRFKVSLYEPESMSAYLDLETMKVFESSFSDKERTIGT